MWRRAALERTDVSEERTAYITKVKEIRELGTSLAVTNSWYFLLKLIVALWLFSTLMMEVIVSSETSVLTATIRLHTPEDGILQT
jgi:hypothetical protein